MKILFDFWLIGISFIFVAIIVTFIVILLVDMLGAVILETQELTILKTLLPRKPYEFLTKLVLWLRERSGICTN